MYWLISTLGQRSRIDITLIQTNIYVVRAQPALLSELLFIYIYTEYGMQICQVFIHHTLFCAKGGGLKQNLNTNMPE